MRPASIWQSAIESARSNGRIHSRLRTIAKNMKAVAISKGALPRTTVPIAELFEFGLDLMNEAAALELVTWETARDFRDGLIISLLAARVFRRKNIVAL